MGNLLYVKRDFLDVQFELSLIFDFNLYQDKLVFLATTLYNAITLQPPLLHHIVPEDITDVYIKKNTFGSTYKIYLKLKFKESFGGSIISDNKICLARSLSIENANRLQNILLDFKNKVTIIGAEHSLSEIIKHTLLDHEGQIGYRMEVLLPKFLKVTVLAFLPVLVALLFFMFTFIYYYV